MSKILKYSAMVMALGAAVCGFAAQSLDIPQAKQNIVIDGHISANEWQNAVEFSTFVTTQGFPVKDAQSRIRLTSDDRYLYLAITTEPGAQTDTASPHLVANRTRHDDSLWHDDALELIIGPQNKSKMFQIIVNSRDAIFDTQTLPINNLTWSVKGMVSKSSVKGVLWHWEARIPFAAVGIRPGAPFLLNIARDWSRDGASSLTGSGYFDSENMLVVRPQSHAAKFTQNFAQQENRFTVTASGDSDVQCRVELRSPKNKLLKKFTAQLAARPVKIPAVLSPTEEFDQLRLLFIRGGKTIFERNLKLKDNRVAWLPPAMQKLILTDGTKIDLRFYPGYGRVGLLAFTPAGNKATSLVVTGKNQHGATVQKKFALKDHKVHGVISVPTVAPASWNFSVATVNAQQVKLAEQQQAFTFKLPKYAWQGLKLGMEDIILPPFTPIKRQGKKIEVLLRQYTAGQLGLWSQINAQGRELLRRPIALQARVNGQKVIWHSQVGQVVAAKPSSLTMRYQATGQGLRAMVEVTYDYDGMALYTLALLPLQKNLQVDELYLTLPLKDQEVKYIHTLADDIRENVCGAIPRGQGKIWDSSVVPRLSYNGKVLVRDGFIPYLWLGGRSRGVSFFADSPTNYHLTVKNPMVKIFRNQGALTAQISLWNKPVNLTAPQTLQFGMLATPVKPKAEFNQRITGITYGKLPGAEIVLFPPTPPYINYFDHEPRAAGWALTTALAQQVHQKNVPEARFNELVKQWKPALLDYWTPYEKNLRRAYGRYAGKRKPLDYWIGRLTNEYRKAVKSAQYSDKLIYYSDSRLVDVNTPEYRDFRAEWWCTRPVGYIGAARNFMVPSNIDYVLWASQQQLLHGADGIYYDDTFLLPRANAEIDQPEMEMGILAMRELVKRTAVMAHQLKGQALVMVHYTDALIIPAFSFANLGFTWEMRFDPVDTQIRFPEDYIFTETAGNQCGMTNFIINGIKHWSGIVNTPQWPSFFKHKSKSIIATTLQYDIKLWSNWDLRQDIAYWTLYPIYKFGLADADCRFIPFWENQSLVEVSPQYRAGLYLKPQGALIFLSNFGAKTPAQIRLNLAALKLPATATVTDLLTGKTYPANRKFGVEVPFHEYTLLHIGNPQQAAKLLPKPGRDLINNPPEVHIDPESGSVKKTLLKSNLPWTKRPGFIAKRLNTQATMQENAQGELEFRVDNSKMKRQGGMVWTLDLPLKLNQEYCGIKITFSESHTNTAQPICMALGWKGNKSKIVYFNPKKDLTVRNGERELQSLTLLKGAQELKRLYIRVEARPHQVGKLVLKDLVFLKSSSPAAAQAQVISLRKAQNWINRPNFVGQKGRSVNMRSELRENADGNLTFVVNNSGQDRIGGMVWTLDQKIDPAKANSTIAIKFGAQNLAKYPHFCPLAMSCTFADGQKRIKEFNLNKCLLVNSEGNYLNSDILKGVKKINRIFVRVHAKPDKVGSFTIKKIELK